MTSRTRPRSQWRRSLLTTSRNARRGLTGGGGLRTDMEHGQCEGGRRLAVIATVVSIVLSGINLVGLSPGIAHASNTGSLSVASGTIYFSGFNSSFAPTPDSFNANGEAGNPGAPWNITAAASGNGPFILLTDANGNVYEANTDDPSLGRNQVKVANECADSQLFSPLMALDPSGSQVAYWAGGALHVAFLDGSGDNVLTASSSLNVCGELTWSPDGRWITVGYSSGGLAIVATVGPNKGTVTLVDSNGGSPAWSPGGRTLYEISTTNVSFVPCNGVGTYSASDVESVSIDGNGLVGTPHALGVAYGTCEGGGPNAIGYDGFALGVSARPQWPYRRMDNRLLFWVPTASATCLTRSQTSAVARVPRRWAQSKKSESSPSREVRSLSRKSSWASELSTAIRSTLVFQIQIGV